MDHDESENCLLCFTKCDDLIILNSQKGIDFQIKDILLKYFWLKLPDNDLARVICTLCWKNIISFHEFYIRIESIHKTYNQTIRIITATSSNLLSNNCRKANNLIDGLPIVSVKDESSLTIREEVYITETGHIKHEQLDIENICDDIVNHNEVKKYVQITSSPSKELKILSQTQSKVSHKRIRKKKLSTKHDYSEQNEKLLRYCRMECDLCGDRFTEFTKIRQHYREKHNQKGYIRCCGIKLYDFSKAMQHYQWHENPEAFKCELCHKCYTDKFKLKSHFEQTHVPQNERSFKCEICAKSYAREYLLLQHKKISHPREEDKKFECDVCKLKFAVMSLLRAHIRRVHEYSDSRICDICAKFFKCAKGYDHHYLVEHTNTQHKVQCELCGTWVKHEASLKGHMLRQHRAFVRQSCELCGKTCPNKKALSSHIRMVHKFIEYPCTICDKPFKKKQTLKEHMAQHTGEKDLYTCLFCTKTFRSSANMYAHRKRAHPKEYEENRLLGKKYPDVQQ